MGRAVHIYTQVVREDDDKAFPKTGNNMRYNNAKTGNCLDIQKSKRNIRTSKHSHTLFLCASHHIYLYWTPFLKQRNEKKEKTLSHRYHLSLLHLLNSPKNGKKVTHTKSLTSCVRVLTWAFASVRVCWPHGAARGRETRMDNIPPLPLRLWRRRKEKYVIKPIKKKLKKQNVVRIIKEWNVRWY